MLALADRSDHRLERELRRQVGSTVTPGPGGLLGLELEFSVRSGEGGRVHFGSLIHRLALDGSALDPGDPNAYRCSWGGVITSDGAEAEIATPPVRTRPGFTGELEAWARTGEAALRRVLPCGIELDGYSAHLSAAMPDRLNDAVCRMYVSTFAADLMLLMERADSPGLLVRPRPGRTELCGEFIDGASLPAAAAFVAGTTRACAAAVRSRSARALLPPSLDVRIAGAVHRYGWYVDRRAFGADLHGHPGIRCCRQCSAGRSARNRTLSSRGRQRGGRWQKTLPRRTCRQPTPWSPVRSPCRPSTGHRAVWCVTRLARTARFPAVTHH